MKAAVAWLLDALRINTIARLTLGSSYTRVVNYHKIKDFRNFNRQLAFYKSHFHPAGLPFRKSKMPGIILTFDDGLESHYEASRMLEQYGFKGWFFISPALVGKKGYLSWAQVKEMAKKHHIGCHTMNHTRIDADTDLKSEVVDAKEMIEKEIGPIESFAWVGGELHHYYKAAHIIIRNHFKYVFQTVSRPYRGRTPHAIPRTNIESHWSMALVKFQLSGLLDILYLPKRLLLNIKLS